MPAPLATPRLVAAGGMVLVSLWLAGPAVAQDAPPTDWQQLPLQDPIVRLFTPRSGAFLVQAKTVLYRSDDAGASWQPVPTPHTAPIATHRLAADERSAGMIAVDPSNHQTIYVSGPDGLYRTADGGQTWQSVRPTALGVDAVAVSPASSALVYMVQGDGQLGRSQDGGQTWQDLAGETFGGPYGGAGRGGAYGCELTAMLFPHPQVANRLILSILCHAGPDEARASAGDVDQSFDQGNARVAFLRPDWAPAYHGALVGGQGAAPTRFYTTTDTSSLSMFQTRVLNSRLFRSDDDGAHWGEVTGIWDDPGDASFVQVGGLVEDAANPDTLYVGLNQFSRNSPRLGYARTRSWVRASGDGGQSWADLGCADLGQITDLALGIDGRNLYAGTSTGVWRLPLPAGSAASATCDASAA